MSPEEFAAKMAEIARVAAVDPEVGHGDADDLLCEVLCQLGYAEGVRVFEDMDKWYA